TLKRDADAAHAYSVCMALEPGIYWSWHNRGLARLRLKQHASALADFTKTLELKPDFDHAYINRALAHQGLKQYPEAVADLSRALALHPDYVPARSGRGVLLARLGKRADALADAKEVLKRDTEAQTLYEVACIYALTTKQQPDDRLEAFRLLSAALREGFGYDLIATDTDLVALRPYAEFRKL